MYKRASTTMILMAAFAVAGCSRSADSNQADAIAVQNGQSATPMGPAPAETKGQDFVSAVLGRYDFAQESAKLAAEKAGRADVQDYARKLADDLARSREELTRIAAASQLKLEGTSADTASTDLAVLRSGSGAPLAAAFAERQLDNLSQLVGLMRAYGDGGDNPQLKAWAAKNQSVVNDRLTDLQTLNATLAEEAEKKTGA